jgi:RNA polymerase sigma-70 factor, ECF subfamily
MGDIPNAMFSIGSQRITGLLQELRSGDRSAQSRIIPLIYPELRKIAARYMRRERADHTLQPTALVHEVYLRMVGHEQQDWQNRAHFFAVAAGLMREILVDHARKRISEKRGGGACRVQLDETLVKTDYAADKVLDIDRAIRNLSELDPRQAEVVVMRVFGGLTEKEIAIALDVSDRTVKRDWKMAKAWLRDVLSPSGSKNDA